jgi:hypothetical protein
VGEGWFAVFIFRAKLVRTRGVAQVAGHGDAGVDRRPDQLIVLVVEEAHRFCDVRLAVDGVGALGNLDRVLGGIGHVSVRARFGGGFHEIGLQLA